MQAEAIETPLDDTARQRADAPAPLAEPKRIAVFSDGTGNSSRALFRTNVYRLYEALNLGHTGNVGGGKGGRARRPRGTATQIAYYDNGVGTSAFRLFAVLGGVFGFGLRRNLLDLYKFVCRNYNDCYEGCTGSDTIYAFGFSRGAFTIRLLVALICTQGIVPYQDERELHRNCSDALRRFMNQNAPDNFPWVFQIIRWLRGQLLSRWRAFRGQQYDVQAQIWPDIEFVGVWDTVAAYGGPVVEVTRGIDQYVWPLTFTDYALNPKVKMARHALALDDERDSFWPLLWDESAEYHGSKGATDPKWTDEQKARAGNRIKQVWFAGMHSDVGGGYPDDSLSYVSLQWMIEEMTQGLAPDKQLDLLPHELVRIAAFANPLGPLHDSRQGLASLYRYQPRKIAAMLHRSIADTVGMNQTRILRDPTIGEKKHRPQGLLRSCKVHRSVIERIAVGADNYAPIVLPRKFDVEPPYAPDDGSAMAQAARNIADRTRAAARGEQQENAWNLVWARRVCHLLLMLIVFVLVSSPFWTSIKRIEVGATDDRWLINDLFDVLSALVPGFARPWYDALTHYWVEALILFGLIALLVNTMGQLESALRDRVRILWWDAVAGEEIEKNEPSALRVIRNSILYQAVLQFWKWRVLPFLSGIGILAVTAYVVLAIWTQVSLMEMERQTFSLCTTSIEKAKSGYPTSQLVGTPSDALAFDPAKVCSPKLRVDNRPIKVAAGQRYYLVIEDPGGAGWKDGNANVPVGGQSAGKYGWPRAAAMYGGSVFRRVVKADWLEPLVEIRSVEPANTISAISERKIAINRLTPVPTPAAKPGEAAKAPPVRYIALFRASRDGSVHVFLNDAMMPHGFTRNDIFYSNNGIGDPPAAKDGDRTGLARPSTKTIRIVPAALMEACLGKYPVEIWTEPAFDYARCAPQPMPSGPVFSTGSAISKGAKWPRPPL